MHLNQALKFILPIIATDTMRDLFFLNKYFIGCFIADTSMNKFKDKILLAYKFTLDTKFIDFDRIIEENPYFLIGSDYDYDDPGITIYVFNVPKQYLEDYQLILEGKYSEISTDLKLKILKFWCDEHHQSLLHSILFKGEKIKNFWVEKGLNPIFYCAKNEYWYKPNLQQEVFDISNYSK